MYYLEWEGWFEIYFFSDFYYYIGVLVCSYLSIKCGGGSYLMVMIKWKKLVN